MRNVNARSEAKIRRPVTLDGTIRNQCTRSSVRQSTVRSRGHSGDRVKLGDLLGAPDHKHTPAPVTLGREAVDLERDRRLVERRVELGPRVRRDTTQPLSRS
jgi:hypothetical protein